MTTNEVSKTPSIAVWHGHHDCQSPLEFLGETFKQRLHTIKTTKADEETPKQIELRLKLFKPVAGKLAVAFNRAGAEFSRAMAEFDRAMAEFSRARAELDRTRAEFSRAMAEHMPAIMELHAIECGCAWSPGNTNIFHQLEN